MGYLKRNQPESACESHCSVCHEPPCSRLWQVCNIHCCCPGSTCQRSVVVSPHLLCVLFGCTCCTSLVLMSRSLADSCCCCHLKRTFAFVVASTANNKSSGGGPPPVVHRRYTACCTMSSSLCSGRQQPAAWQAPQICFECSICNAYVVGSAAIRVLYVFGSVHEVFASFNGTLTCHL